MKKKKKKPIQKIGNRKRGIFRRKRKKFSCITFSFFFFENSFFFFVNYKIGKKRIVRNKENLFFSSVYCPLRLLH